MKSGDVIAVRNDGATLLYDADDEYGRPLGRIRQGRKTYEVRPMMALLAKGGWEPAEEPVTAAGQSWRWQLRDAEGQWLEMGSEVRWLSQGRWLNGRVIGSPSPGIATIEESGTKNLRDLPAARLEVLEVDAQRSWARSTPAAEGDYPGHTHHVPGERRAAA